MKKIKTTQPLKNIEQFKMLDHYLLSIKKELNKFAHTNITGVMTSFTNRFQVPESIRFNKIAMKYLIYLLEGPFLVIFNKNYNSTLKLPLINSVNAELKTVGTLAYASRNFPESIKKFIEDSDVLKTFYLKTIEDFQKNINFDFQKNKFKK